MKKLKVYIADDHTLFRKAMVGLLQSFKDISVVKDAENGKELLKLVKYEQPDVAIVDLQMPVMDGVETCEHLVQKFPSVKLVVLTMHDSEKYVLHMIEMGVHAFLLKNTEPVELERAILSVVEKDFYHNDFVANIIRKNIREKAASARPTFKAPELSEREKEIVLLICRELTNKEIGDRLFISERTVENHRYRILEKLQIKSAVGLVRFAYEAGLVK
ncbi:MAG: response regulator transcription factor [Cyclobacteriaceae bacterium]